MGYRETLQTDFYLGNYRIIEVLGTGGFGVTYKALDEHDQKFVAIKEYFPKKVAIRDESNSIRPESIDLIDDYNWGLDRFLEEAKTIALFRHPNIVHILKFFKENNSAYIVLSFEDGVSLKEWLNLLGRKPSQEELDHLILPLIDALHVIHKNGLLHRDIAPDNIIMRYNGGPVLVDFGAARSALNKRKNSFNKIVKRGFSPHEQYSSNSQQQGPWSDIYAMAATIHYAITGKAPPKAPDRLKSDVLESLSSLEDHEYRSNFLKAIDQALSIDPRHRPQNIRDWEKQLFLNNKTNSKLFPINSRNSFNHTNSNRNSNKSPKNKDVKLKSFLQNVEKYLILTIVSLIGLLLLLGLTLIIYNG